METSQDSKSLRAIDYVREHVIEQRLEEFIGQVVHERPSDPYGSLANSFAEKSQPPTIAYLKGNEILLSTGRPSLQIEVYANSLGRTKKIAASEAPIGISAFSLEFKPMIDTNTTRFLGMGSKNAISLVETLSVALQGKNFTTIDQFDIAIKKTFEGKSSIVNVLTAASFALAKASAIIMNQPLFLYLYESLYPQQSADHFAIPVPAMTILEGGMHSHSPLFFEAVYVIPKSSISFIEQLRMCVEVSHKMRTKLNADKRVFSVGKTGGLVADVQVLSTAISLVERAIIESGFSPGTDFSIGIDCAASNFFDPEKQRYQVEKGVYKTSPEIVQYYIDLVTQHPSVNLINDSISEVDHSGWELIKTALTGRIKIFGGDVYASQSILARRGLKKGWTNGILIQPGQAGLLSDAASTARLFKQKGKQVIIARRAGETCDSLIADFSVAIQSEYYVGGGIFGSEGATKYNNLIRIYEYLRDRSMLL